MIGETKVERGSLPEGTRANIKNACGLAFIKVPKKAISKLGKWRCLGCQASNYEFNETRNAFYNNWPSKNAKTQANKQFRHE